MKKYDYKKIFDRGLQDIIDKRNKYYPNYRIVNVIRIDIFQYEALLERVEDINEG